MSSLLDSFDRRSAHTDPNAPDVVERRAKQAADQARAAAYAAEENVLGIYGLPADLGAQINSLRAQYPHTVDGDAQFAQAAIHLVRGSAWYAQTFPGIKEAQALGFIGTELGAERQYKQMYNAYNATYQQYQGRHMTWDEAYRLFASGAQPDFVAHQFAGAAYVSANKPDIQYYSGAFGTGPLNQQQLDAYGQEQTGYDTPLGQKLASQFQTAVQRFERVFAGTLAAPGQSLGGAGLKSDSLLGDKVTPDLPA